MKIRKLGEDVGLACDELIVTGYVSDDDLLTLYNACLALVLPSLHEGFGLPALEAMQCGKAVLAANSSSLPEVVGRRDALFDPRDDAAIAAALRHVMEDDAFRAELERHGPAQAAKFSWDNSAQRAIAAVEMAVEKFKQSKPRQPAAERKRMAFVSPLPPDRSGLSDYCAELLAALHAFYEIDTIVDQPLVSGECVVANHRQLDFEWFRTHFGEYDRILYHFGNSPLQRSMFELLELAPGSVVLHDFYLSEIQNDRGHSIFLRALKESHGYRAVLDGFTSPGKAINIYPTNLAVIQNSVGVIVHREVLRQLANQWYGAETSQEWILIPHLRSSVQVSDEQRADARKLLCLPADSSLICSFGTLEPMKLNDRLIKAFLTSKLAKDPKVHLIFVGEIHDGEFGRKLWDMISGSWIEDRIRITGWADPEIYRAYLKAADFAIQLRGLSRGESSRTIFDCMSHGLATVVNANGAMAEFDRTGVLALDDVFDDDELTEALERLAQDYGLRKEIGARAQDIVRTWHAPSRCAALYFKAIEGFYASDANQVGGLVRKLSAAPLTAVDVKTLSSTLSRNFPPQPRLRQLLVDVSVIAVEDLKTGIQRVVRAILRHWLMNPPRGWSVEPVYTRPEQPGYWYARQFTCAFLEIDASWATDEKVDAWQGDTFIGLDLHPGIVPVQKALEAWYRFGVEVRFVVYDLLPVLRPEYFRDRASETHSGWLATVTSFAGAVCISQSVAGELRNWCDARTGPRSIPFVIDWFHLGADIGMSVPSLGMTGDEKLSLSRMRRVSTFLMVGTVEPRKGHRQALDAFEILWGNGIEANLVIVGKPGWKTDDFIKRVKEHPELANRLFWHDNATDEFLEQLYSLSHCLLVASEGEGFGLPLIEAAHQGLPIIARDLPVFKEVAREHAFYFNGLEPEDLATAVTEWLKLYEARSHIQSSGISWLTWTQSAEMLLARLGIRAPPEDVNPSRPPRESPPRGTP